MEQSLGEQRAAGNLARAAAGAREHMATGARAQLSRERQARILGMPERRAHSRSDAGMHACGRPKRAGTPVSFQEDTRGGAHGAHAQARARERSWRKARGQTRHSACAQPHGPARAARELAPGAGTGRRSERCQREEEASGLRMPGGAPGAGEPNADARRRRRSAARKNGGRTAPGQGTAMRGRERGSAAGHEGAAPGQNRRGAHGRGRRG
jgi:hypothetical protein